MKRNGLLWLCVALVSLLSYTSMMAQNDEISQQQADKLNSLTFKLAKQGRYEDAIKSKERELAILKTLYGERDRSYIKELGYNAKLYYRNASAAEIHYTPPTWTISHSIRLHKTNMMTLLPIARGHWIFMTV